MKSLAYTALLACLASSTVAHPGQKWARMLDEIKARAAAPIDSPEDSFEMIGDLVSPGPVTAMGKVSTF
jgi:hypothetical protein